jgi:hypothetical protein
MCAPVDGLLGWRVVTLPDGSRRGEDLAGRSVVVPPGRGRNRSPRWVLEFPGADRPLAVIQEYDGIRLLDGNGTVMAEIPRDHTAGTFTAGTPLLPPLRYWHLLRPRDPQGSAALRQVDENTAAALLSGPCDGAARGHGGPGRSGAGAGRRGHAARAGSAPAAPDPHAAAAGRPRGAAHRHRGVVRFAAEQQRVLDAARTRLDTAVAGRVREEQRPELSDGALTAALQGLGLNGRRYLVQGRAYYYHDRPARSSGCCGCSGRRGGASTNRPRRAVRTPPCPSRVP